MSNFKTRLSSNSSKDAYRPTCRVWLHKLLSGIRMFEQRWCTATGSCSCSRSKLHTTYCAFWASSRRKVLFWGTILATPQHILHGSDRFCNISSYVCLFRSLSSKNGKEGKGQFRINMGQLVYIDLAFWPNGLSGHLGDREFQVVN